MSDYNNIDIYDFFKDTLNNCGAFLLDMSDEEIGYDDNQISKHK